MLIILLIVLCIVLFGLKYWLIGAAVGVVVCILGFIKLFNDDKKNRKEYLEFREKYNREHGITKEDELESLEVFQNQSTEQYVQYLINRAKLKTENQNPQK